jgi:hypothetical protein
MVIRGYIKGRTVSVVLGIQVTLHSAASWINQELILFITLINTIYKDKQFS